MLQRLVILLILANLLFFAWSRGWLEQITGSRVHLSLIHISEPTRPY